VEITYFLLAVNGRQAARSQSVEPQREQRSLGRAAMLSAPQLAHASEPTEARSIASVVPGSTIERSGVEVTCTPGLGEVAGRLLEDISAGQRVFVGEVDRAVDLQDDVAATR
jgi:hypothetical protein